MKSPRSIAGFMACIFYRQWLAAEEKDHCYGKQQENYQQWVKGLDM
jgi:hypothetical protein